LLRSVPYEQEDSMERFHKKISKSAIALRLSSGQAIAVIASYQVGGSSLLA
jgi:uncharacterized protein YoaH (UPF0181 family)